MRITYASGVWLQASQLRRDDRAVRWLDGNDANPLVLQFADDHHAFHEDAKPGDLTGQFGTLRFSSSVQLSTTIN